MLTVMWRICSFYSCSPWRTFVLQTEISRNFLLRIFFTLYIQLLFFFFLCLSFPAETIQSYRKDQPLLYVLETLSPTHTRPDTHLPPPLKDSVNVMFGIPSCKPRKLLLKTEKNMAERGRFSGKQIYCDDLENAWANCVAVRICKVSLLKDYHNGINHVKGMRVNRPLVKSCICSWYGRYKSEFSIATCKTFLKIKFMKYAVLHGPFCIALIQGYFFFAAYHLFGPQLFCVPGTV